MRVCIIISTLYNQSLYHPHAPHLTIGEFVSLSRCVFDLHCSGCGHDACWVFGLLTLPAGSYYSVCFDNCQSPATLQTTISGLLDDVTTHPLLIVVLMLWYWSSACLLSFTTETLGLAFSCALLLLPTSVAVADGRVASHMCAGSQQQARHTPAPATW